MNNSTNYQNVGDINAPANNINTNISGNNNKSQTKNSKDENSKTKNKENVIINIAMALSILAVIVSIPAIILAVPRASELDFDYYGVIIGILSLLVTVLIGWNIYSLIDVKAIQNANEELKKDIKRIASRIYVVERNYNNGLEQIESTLGMLFYYERRSSNNSVLAYQSIYHWLRAILMASEKENFDSCAGYVVSLLLCSKDLPAMSKDNKDLLLHTYNGITDKHKIQNINLVKKAIDSIVIISEDASKL